MSEAAQAINDVVVQRDTLRDQIRALGKLVETKLNSDVVSTRKQTQVLQIMTKMHADLAKLVDLKQQNGYLEELVRRAPSHQAPGESIEKEYVELLRELRRLHDELIDDGHGLKTRRHVHGWLRRLIELDKREWDFLQELGFGGS